MTPEEILQKFEQTSGQWAAALGNYSAEQFGRKPSETEWSIGQVYQHLLNSTRNFQLRMIDRCLAGDAAVDATMSDTAQGMFAAGSFPQTRIAVPPSATYTPPERHDPAAIAGELDQAIDAVRQTAPRLAEADPARTTDHPFLGPLNALQWYQLIEMHWRHHIAQKERLDAWLGVE